MTLRSTYVKASMLVAVVLMVVGILMSTSLSASAVEQGGLGGRPANPRDDNPRSQSIFVHKLDNGEQVSDVVEVINGTSETKHIAVYAVDSQVSSGGTFACAQAADKSIAVGGWVALQKKELTLAAKETQEVAFTIKVPKDASPGEHNGCIVIQDMKQQRAPDSNGIVLSMRSAIRLAITVPGDIHKGLTFAGLGVQPKDDKKILLSTGLKNNGNVSLDAQLDIKLLYAFGTTATTASGSFPVLSGSEARFNFEGGRPFWGGWYRLVATAKYNNDPVVAVGEGRPNASTTQSAWTFVAPQPMAALIEGVVLAGIAGGATLLVRRYVVHRTIRQGRTTHEVVAKEDIRTIADDHGMSWKLLARINKLKPPYQLKAGQVLLVAPAKPDIAARRQRPRHRK